MENGIAVQAAAQPIIPDGETAPEADESTEPTVTYRLKDEYAAPVQADDDIAFSADNDIALQSGDYQGAAQSATIMVVDSDALYLHIVDENGNGITGASVTYSLNNTESIRTNMTQTLQADGELETGMLKLDTSALQTDDASLFLNVSAPDYYGITRIADIVEVGSVLTYTLRTQSVGDTGLYLRGCYIDDVDTRNGYTLMLTGENTDRYPIIAIVGMANGTGIDALPDTLTMRTENKTNPGYGKKEFTSAAVEKDTKKNYGVYRFTDTWSHYTDKLNEATLRNGDTLYLTKPGEYQWLTTTKNNDGTTTVDAADTVDTGITAELPDLERLGFVRNISLSLCGGGGINVSVPDHFLGGDESTLSSDLLTVPVLVYVTLQGSLLLGFGPVLSIAETKWLQDPQNNPQSQNPGTQAKTEKLIERIKTQTMDAFSVKNNYQEKQKKRADLYNKLKDLKNNGKRVMSTASGNIDWTGAVFLFGRIDPRSYTLTADLGLSMDWTGDLQVTTYLMVGPVPFYVGAELMGVGGGTAVVGVQTDDFYDLSQYKLSNDTSLTLTAMIMVEVVLGAGLRGIVGLEGFANGNIAGTVQFRKPPEGTKNTPARFRATAGVNAGLRVRLFFVTYTKTWRLIDEILYDSWGIYDGGDPDTPSPSALMANNELPQYSVLLADPEVRAAAADAANQEWGVFAETLDGIEPEVSIAQDGTQQDLRANEPALLADETAGQSAVTGITTQEKTQVMTGSDFQYISCEGDTYLFRIATVNDAKMGKVARVVYSKGNADGQSSSVIALPATEENGKWYGYDTNFAVNRASDEMDVAYVAIVSAPSANTTDVAKQAAESRLRVLRVNLKDGSVEGSVVVKKAPLENGRTDYAYTGTPTVCGGSEAHYGIMEDGIHSYMAACAVTTDVAALANGTLTQGSDALAIATNRNSNSTHNRDYIDASVVWQDGIRRTSLTFANTKIFAARRGGWGLVSVDLDQPQTMDILDINYYSDTLEVVPNTRLSVLHGTISNLQHPSQNYWNDVFFTCDGDLYRLEQSDNQYSGFKQVTDDKTDVGDDVALPAGDGLTLLGMWGSTAIEKMYAVYTTARNREETDGSGNKRTVTDTVVRVYSLFGKEDGTYTVSGPRESVIENRTPVKTAAVGIVTGSYVEQTVRVMYLANQNFVQTSQPSGSIAVGGSYQAGTVQDTSDLYMWELRPGKAAELGGFTPTTSTIQRRRSQTVDCDININNVGGYPIKNVTVEVRKDSPNGTLVGNYTVEAKGDSFASLGPGSDMNTTLQIPIGQDWNGEVTLYAAITKADGEAMSTEFTPVWIGTDQLIKEGKVTMAVSQRTAGYYMMWGQYGLFVDTIATVRIGYEKTIDPHNLKLRISKLSFDENGKERWNISEPEEIDLSSCPAISATNPTVNLTFRMGSYWRQGITAVKFEVLGANDITMNCLYTTGQVLLCPEVARKRGVNSEWSYNADAFRVVVRNQDSYYGTVETNRDIMVASTAAQVAAYAADNAADDTATLTATPRAGYSVDHWEYLSGNNADGQNVWMRLKDTHSADPNVCIVRYADFIQDSATQTTTDDIGNTVIVRAVYADSSSTNVRVMTDVQSTENDGTTPQNAAIRILAADGNSLTGTATMGGVAFDVAKNTTVTLRAVDYEPLDWTFDGWYAYTLDEYGNKTVGAKLSGEEAYTLTPAENQYIMAKLRPRTEALVYLDAAGGTTGSDAADESQLCLQRANTDGTVYLPALTREKRVFKGWVSNANIFYDGGDSVKVQKDGEVFTALWRYEHASVYTWTEEGGTTSGNVYDVLPGTQVTVNAYPYDGWKFDHWAQYDYSASELVRIDGAEAEYTFTMGTETVSLCAVFVKIDPATPDPVTPGKEDQPSDTPKPADTAADTATDTSSKTTAAKAQPDSADQAQAASGSTPAKQTVIPRTADEFPLLFVIVLLAVSACGFGAAAVLRSKRRKK